MSPRAHRSTILLLAAALAATALVAVGLPRLRLSPGLPLPSVSGGQLLVEGDGASGPARVPVSTALLAVLAVGAGALLLLALWRALRGVRLRSALVALLRGILLLAAVCLAVLVLALIPLGGPVTAPEAPAPPLLPAPRAPLGDPPPLVLWFTAGGLLVAASLAAAWLLRPPPPRREPLDLVGLEAERARDALLAGDDARGVILACYARMSAALAREQGIERPGSMTAREFVDLLGSLGVPRPPVQELTRLFEAARYGGRRPGAGEQARALACLGPIVEHCRTAPRSHDRAGP